MSKLTAVRLDEKLLARVDKERKKSRISRSRAIHEALALWVMKRREDAAIARDQEGYLRYPVSEDEFASVLGAQSWPE